MGEIMSITVSITELLQAVGSENINFQILSAAMERISTKKGITIVSFATDAITPADVTMGNCLSGIVVWVDQGVLRERLDELKQGNCVTYEKLANQRDELLAAAEKAIYECEDLIHTQAGCALIEAIEKAKLGAK